MKMIRKSIVIVLLLVLMTASFSVNHMPGSAFANDIYEVFIPFIANFKQPLASLSYYITSVDEAYMYHLGCEQGKRDQMAAGVQDSVSVLNFSYPICYNDGRYGADIFPLFDQESDVELSLIASGVKYFASGYYTCSGSDNLSNLVIGVGTNNKSSVTPSYWPLSEETCDGEELAAAHGAAWGDMVSEINRWALDAGIFHQVQFYGASDIELGWNAPGWSRAWIEGFEQNGENFLIHYGDAAGCPYEDNPHWSCGTSTFKEWTPEDVWFVSYGSPSALPLPLIFLTNGVHAKQWAHLSRYSVQQHGYRMHFSGVFTQYTICSKNPWQSCVGRDNSPEAAYHQLVTELSKNAFTTQDLRWKADIDIVYLHEISLSESPLSASVQSASDHPVYQEIMHLRAALQSPSLSPRMRNSLEFKLALYESIAVRIQLSKLNPASKDLPVPLP